MRASATSRDMCMCVGMSTCITGIFLSFKISSSVQKFTRSVCVCACVDDDYDDLHGRMGHGYKRG